MTILNSVLELAVRDEIIPKNYMKNIDRPKQVKIKEMITLNANEIKQFLNVITNSEHYALFKLAFASGMRRSELLGLTWSNVHFNKSTISIEQTALRINGGGVLSPTTKTDSSRRTISIDADTMAILRKHKTTIDKRMLAAPNWTNHNLVFPGIHGGPRNPDEVSRSVSYTHLDVYKRQLEYVLINHVIDKCFIFFFFDRYFVNEVVGRMSS